MYIGGRGFSGVSLCSRQLCCKPQMAVSLANSRASRLCVYPFDPLSAPYGSHEWIRKVLCFPRDLVVPELHDAHGVGRLAVICQNEFGDPFQNRWHRTPSNADPVPHGSLDLALQNTAPSFVDRSF